MSTFTESWGDAQVSDSDQERSNLDPPADGDYTVTLVKGAAFTSKKEEDWVVLELRDVETAYEWTLMLGFRSQPQANVTKTACSRLGIQVDEVASLTELNTQLDGLAGGYFEVSVKTNGEYRNTYVNGPARPPAARTDVPVPDEELAVAAVDDGDDVPF